MNYGHKSSEKLLSFGFQCEQSYLNEIFVKWIGSKYWRLVEKLLHVFSRVGSRVMAETVWLCYLLMKMC